MGRCRVGRGRGVRTDKGEERIEWGKRGASGEGLGNTRLGSGTVVCLVLVE